MKRLSKYEIEVVCERCDGAGMIPEKGAHLGVSICTSCNGHGCYVKLTPRKNEQELTKRIVKYAPIFPHEERLSG